MQQRDNQVSAARRAVSGLEPRAIVQEMTYNETVPTYDHESYHTIRVLYILYVIVTYTHKDALSFIGQYDFHNNILFAITQTWFMRIYI